MDHIKAARNAEFANRTGLPSVQRTVGDVSHLHALRGLAEGIANNLNFTSELDKPAVSQYQLATRNLDNAYDKHTSGDATGAASYAALAAHHITNLGRLRMPSSPEEAAENYDPYVINAVSSNPLDHLNNFISSINGGN